MCILVISSFDEYVANQELLLPLFIAYNRWRMPQLISLNPEGFRLRGFSLEQFMIKLDIMEETSKLSEKHLENIKSAFQNSAWKWLVVEESNAIGMVDLWRKSDDIAELRSLFVLPTYRGKKLSTLLLEKVVEKARDVGFSKIVLDTLPFMESAIAVYEKFGFKRTSYIDFGYGGGEAFSKSIGSIFMEYQINKDLF
ncbi:MAG: GNAT family N-acetyltransferase [Candidatus Heimdallarchaeota archaeon]|nr:GNAT family N-acetyltransferase [Candidatus Heimdallarchaeota archaeon]